MNEFVRNRTIFYIFIRGKGLNTFKTTESKVRYAICV